MRTDEPPLRVEVEGAKNDLALSPEQLAEISLAPGPWLRYLGMLAGGPPVEMPIHNPNTGKKIYTAKVWLYERNKSRSSMW